eukprot:m.5058 g.5058  ORF g.5058 m.5058 type:complete len:57 (-) comp2331_c0_seq1:2561-2731(-)
MTMKKRRILNVSIMNTKGKLIAVLLLVKMMETIVTEDELGDDDFYDDDYGIASIDK